MDLHLPDDLVRGIDMSEEQWMLDLAIGLYVDRRLTLGRAAELARISKPAFLDELGRRQITINYDVDDLEGDLQTIAALRSDQLMRKS
jgi:predicted HTH domain antitoxin